MNHSRARLVRCASGDAHFDRTSRRASELAFLGACGLIFLACAAVTVTAALAMTPMAARTMCGQMILSDIWILLPGQTWQEGIASFLTMWLPMMGCMMLPSLTPVLWRYHHALSRLEGPRAGLLTASVAVGYFSVWIAIGVTIYPIGVMVIAGENRFSGSTEGFAGAAAAVVTACGLIQLMPWKTQHIAGCANVHHPSHDARWGVGRSWGQGAVFAGKCLRCCGGLMAALVVTDVMDLGAMVLVTAVTTLERRVNFGQGVARASGWTLIAYGLIRLSKSMDFA